MGWEDPLEEEMSTHSSILNWKIPQLATVHEVTESDTAKHTHTHSNQCPIYYTEVQTPNGEGNGKPLQFSCLENPMDGGAWQATLHGDAKSDMTERLHFHFQKRYKQQEEF